MCFAETFRSPLMVVPVVGERATSRRLVAIIALKLVALLHQSDRD